MELVRPFALLLVMLSAHLSPIRLKAQEVLLPLQRTVPATRPIKHTGTQAVTLPFFDDFADGSMSSALWEEGGATVGTGYGEQPPTVGMATLDALGRDGGLYPQASTSPFPADTLCSVTVRLDGLCPADSLVLSFFYLPGGGSGNLWERIGDAPDDGDSVFLDFYRPADSVWQTVWGRGGIGVDSLVAHTGTAWQYVAVAITDSAFFDSTFRFRFRNRCSLEGTTKPGMGGNCDQWNIDYVLLDTARSVSDAPQWRDVAFVSPAPSMLGNYQAMPARQFRAAEQCANLNMTIANLFGSELATHYGYCIIGPDGDTVHRYDGGFENAPVGGYQTMPNHATPPFAGFTFPEDGVQRTYTILHSVSEGVGGDDRPLNDTVRFTQVFADYYAYDDGVAENGYGLTSTASRVYLAYRFDLNAEDTLTAVDMWFNSSYNDENEAIQFYITIWQADDEGHPGAQLYRDTQRRRPVSDTQFKTYVLESPTVLSGSIFVGFEQVGNSFINLGFDRNTQSADRIWYLTSTEWQQSILRGSLMLRPRFGQAATVGIGEVEGEKWHVEIFPNPASDMVKISGIPDGSRVVIYDLYGRPLFTTSNSQISMSNLPSGLYILRVMAPDGTASQTKLSVTR